MSAFYIDTHCHLDLLKDIRTNYSEEDKLPIKTLSVTNAPFLFEPNRKLFVGCENIRVALGMHPELVSQYSSQMEQFEKSLDQTKYIGEIGLDGSQRFSSSFALQKKTFIDILSLLPNAGKKVLTIHSRNAAAETIEILNYHIKTTNCKVILHWYTGDIASLKRAISLGYYFSVNHKMLATEKGRQLVSLMPVSQILTETDAPFTFDFNTPNRLVSLQKCISSIGAVIKRNPEETKSLIYENFKLLTR